MHVALDGTVPTTRAWTRSWRRRLSRWRR